MIREFAVAASVHISSHPLAQHRLALLRDTRTEPPAFRRMVRDLAQMLFLEASTDLPAIGGLRVDQLLTAQPPIALDAELGRDRVEIGERALLELSAVKDGHERRHDGTRRRTLWTKSRLRGPGAGPRRAGAPAEPRARRAAPP